MSPQPRLRLKHAAKWHRPDIYTVPRTSVRAFLWDPAQHVVSMCDLKCCIHIWGFVQMHLAIIIEIKQSVMQVMKLHSTKCAWLKRIWGDTNELEHSQQSIKFRHEHNTFSLCAHAHMQISIFSAIVYPPSTGWTFFIFALRDLFYLCLPYTCTRTLRAVCSSSANGFSTAPYHYTHTTRGQCVWNGWVWVKPKPAKQQAAATHSLVAHMRAAKASVLL